MGSEPAAAKTLQLGFFSSETGKAWTEKSGSLASTKWELDAGGTALSILGRLEAELAGGANWGVFS